MRLAGGGFLKDDLQGKRKRSAPLKPAGRAAISTQESNKQSTVPSVDPWSDPG